MVGSGLALHVRRLLKLVAQQQTPVIVFGSVVALFVVIDGSAFVGSSNVTNIAATTGVTAPLVMGEAIVLISGGIDISVGAVLAMSSALAIGLQPWGVPVAICLAIAFGALVGLINGLLVTVGKLVAFIATLGTMSAVTGLDLTYTHQSGISGNSSSFEVLGQGTIGILPIALVIAVIVLAVFYVILRWTELGRAIYAVGGDKDNAALAGIHVDRTQVIAFTLGGALTGVSGVLLASQLNSSNPQIGVSTVIESLAAAIIGGASLLGGRGSIAGAFLGVASLTALSSGMDIAGVPTYYEIGITACVMIAVVIVDALVIRAVRRRQEGASILGATAPEDESPSHSWPLDSRALG